MKPAASAWKALGAAILSLVAFAAFAQPAWQSSQTAIGTGNATVTKPAATASGDLLVVGLMYEKGSGETITPPAGWSLIRRTDNGTDVGMATYYKVAGGAEPASYTFTIANGSKWSIGISRITGADTSGGPINVSAGQTGPSSTSVTAPSVTTTVANTLVLAFYTNKKHATYTPAGGTTERYDAPNTPEGLPSNMMASFVQASAGATGNRTATASEAEFWIGQQIAITPGVAAPAVGGFNAYDSATAAGAITGAIRTKIAGSTISVDMIALNATRTAIATGFTGTVRVEVLNAADNSGALDANGCRPTWTWIQTLSPDPAFAAGDNGRKTISFTQPNSYPDVRLRITYPAGAPTTIGCSNDNLAIRPSQFAALAVSDNGNWEQAGTTRALNDVTFGALRHKAGRPFSVRATAVNAAATPATTTNYSGAPTATLSACAGAACTVGQGTLALTTTFASGQLSSDTTSYDNVGAFRLQLIDDAFAAVDAGDGSTSAERNITSAAIDVGRFVPDHLAVSASTIVPRSDIAGCAGSAFTYLGERMDVGLTLVARNFAGGTTTFYAGSSFGRFDASNAAAYVFGAIDSAAPTPLTGRISTLPVTVTSNWTAGVAAVVAPIAVNRNATPDGPFASARIGIAPADADGVTLASFNLDADNSGSNERVQVGASTALRFGRLRLENAVGSEKLDLAIPIQAQYWSGTAFQVNGADSCTSISAANAGLGNYFGGITAANMNGANVSGLGGAFSSGFGSLTLTRPVPTPGSSGAVSLTIDLSAEGKSYLKGNWGVPIYTADPSSRAAFGLYGGQPSNFIYFRENF